MSLRLLKRRITNMLLWEVLIREQGKYGEMCCSKSYRYANKVYKKLKNVEKYIVYTEEMKND